MSTQRSWPPPPRPPRPESLELVSQFNQLPLHERPTSMYSRRATQEGLAVHQKELPTTPNDDRPLPPRRRGFHPWKFLKICFRSSCTLSMIVNCLWPVVPAAFVTHYVVDRDRLGNFILPYIAMLPCANLLGFAGRELASELPRVLGVLMETTFGSLVEFILLVILIRKGEVFIPVVQAAVLGSILANLLLCLGLCLFAGGLKRTEQVFHEAISETGTSLMLVAGMGLVLPAIFSAAATEEVSHKVLKISRGTSIMLLVAYIIYVFFQMRSHHGLYDDIFKLEKEHVKAGKEKLTKIESIIAVIIGITCVSFMAYFLVDQIPYIVEKRHVKDAFVGLIMVPLVEKAAEHITAIDEAYEGHLNSAMAHVLGSSVQTALLNTPLIVLVGWGIKVDMNLNFRIFDAAVLILAIVVVGNFLHHRKSNYLEGILCVIVYICLAISAFYYPNDPNEESALERHHAAARMKGKPEM